MRPISWKLGESKASKWLDFESSSVTIGRECFEELWLIQGRSSIDLDLFIMTKEVCFYSSVKVYADLFWKALVFITAFNNLLQSLSNMMCWILKAHLDDDSLLSSKWTRWAHKISTLFKETWNVTQIQSLRTKSFTIFSKHYLPNDH